MKNCCAINETCKQDKCHEIFFCPGKIYILMPNRVGADTDSIRVGRESLTGISSELEDWR